MRKGLSKSLSFLPFCSPQTIGIYLFVPESLIVMVGEVATVKSLTVRK
jgi:hypothetical protein